MAALFLFLLGKTFEALARKEAYKIGDYVVFGTTALVVFIVGDALINFLEGTSNPVSIILSLLLSTLVYFIFVSLGLFIRRAPLHSSSLTGAIVVDRTGVKIGKVRSVRKDSLIVERKEGSVVSFPLDRVKISGRRLVVH